MVSTFDVLVALDLVKDITAAIKTIITRNTENFFIISVVKVNIRIVISDLLEDLKCL